MYYLYFLPYLIVDHPGVFEVQHFVSPTGLRLVAMHVDEPLISPTPPLEAELRRSYMYTFML